MFVLHEFITGVYVVCVTGVYMTYIAGVYIIHIAGFFCRVVCMVWRTEGSDEVGLYIYVYVWVLV